MIDSDEDDDDYDHDDYDDYDDDDGGVGGDDDDDDDYYLNLVTYRQLQHIYSKFCFVVFIFYSTFSICVLYNSKCDLYWIFTYE